MPGKRQEHVWDATGYFLQLTSCFGSKCPCNMWTWFLFVATFVFYQGESRNILEETLTCGISHETSFSPLMKLGWLAKAMVTMTLMKVELLEVGRHFFFCWLVAFVSCPYSCLCPYFLVMGPCGGGNCGWRAKRNEGGGRNESFKYTPLIHVRTSSNLVPFEEILVHKWNSGHVQIKALCRSS